MDPRLPIKRINGAHYKYQVSYAYDPDKKRTVKKSSVVLGKITETGFVPSPKHLLRQALQNPAVDIKTYGVYGLFSFPPRMKSTPLSAPWESPWPAPSSRSP